MPTETPAQCIEALEQQLRKAERKIEIMESLVHDIASAHEGAIERLLELEGSIKSAANPTPPSPLLDRVEKCEEAIRELVRTAPLSI